MNEFDHIAQIKSYILYLKKLGMCVTLHPIGDENVVLPSELITFNIHDNPYCIFVKTFPQARRHCVARQRKVFGKAECGAYQGNCYAGVGEYVYPVISDSKLRCVICVSGYACEGAQSYIRRASELYGMPYEEMKQAYSSLKKQMPQKGEIDTLIYPLISMLEFEYVRRKDGSFERDTLIESVIRYVKQFHTDEVNLENICKEFSCSRSYISHSFKKHTGRTLREYICDLRIEDAKTLLKYSSLSVTEIAFSVGFGDSNYFSQVFKKKLGMTPLEYKNSKDA